MSHKVSRRQFLGAGLAAALAALIAACRPLASTREEAWQTATPPQILQSPMPGAAAGTATPNSISPTLRHFLTLSSLLTGVEELNPRLGELYHRSLVDDDDYASGLASLMATVESGAGSLTDLELADLFVTEASRKAADKINEYWYSGVYKNSAGEKEVATYVDALAWKVLDFTKPATICGQPDFWTQRP